MNWLKNEAMCHHLQSMFRFMHQKWVIIQDGENVGQVLEKLF